MNSMATLVVMVIAVGYASAAGLRTGREAGWFVERGSPVELCSQADLKNFRKKVIYEDEIPALQGISLSVGHAVVNGTQVYGESETLGNYLGGLGANEIFCPKGYTFACHGNSMGCILIEYVNDKKTGVKEFKRLRDGSYAAVVGFPSKARTVG